MLSKVSISTDEVGGHATIRIAFDLPIFLAKWEHDVESREITIRCSLDIGV